MNLELYIDNIRVDLFKDEAITLTDTQQNVRDIGLVFAPFSQQFNLPASSTNNKIFKHYYNYDITNGFDARIRVSAILKLNGVDFKIGKVKLNSVSLKNNKAYSYKVVFFGLDSSVLVLATCFTILSVTRSKTNFFSSRILPICSKDLESNAAFVSLKRASNLSSTSLSSFT